MTDRYTHLNDEWKKLAALILTFISQTFNIWKNNLEFQIYYFVIHYPNFSINQNFRVQICKK
jgi:hypothetical protein